MPKTYFTPHVSGHQPPVCNSQEGGVPDHIGYGDFYIRLSSGHILYCYPCAIVLGDLAEQAGDTETKTAAHSAMVRGMANPRLLRERTAVLEQGLKDRSEAVGLRKGGGNSDFLRILKYRTNQPWKERLEFLCGERGVVYDPEETIDVTAVERAKMGGECLCGCGEAVKVGRRFRQGHDARYHAWVGKLRDGRMEVGEIGSTTRAAMREEYDDLDELFGPEANFQNIEGDVEEVGDLPGEA